MILLASCYGIVSDSFIKFKESFSWNCWYTTTNNWGRVLLYIYGSLLCQYFNKVTCMVDY